MFVGPGVLLQAGNVDAALVGEGIVADVGRPLVMGEVRGFADKPAHLGQMDERLFRRALVSHLEDQVRDEGHQVRVAAPLAVPVRRPLD